VSTSIPSLSVDRKSTKDEARVIGVGPGLHCFDKTYTACNRTVFREIFVFRRVIFANPATVGRFDKLCRTGSAPPRSDMLVIVQHP